MKSIKINTVIIDDERRALDRFKLLLQNLEEINTVGQFSNSKEGLKFVNSNNPDIVFLDVEMPDLTGIEFVQEVHKNNLDTKIVFVTAHEHYAIEAIKNEVFDYLLKPVGIHHLKEVIRRFKTNIKANFTKRELEIVRLISQGENSKDIGKILFISNHTVDTYRRRILEKTDCKNAAELILYASRRNLV